ncbi:MAG: STAS domain-containing protein [Phycisphaerae bacterium]|nr:STAS domain-containing protein [Phycisphaerae bacterium]
MGIQKWSDDIMVVDLNDEPQLTEDLKAFTEQFKQNCDCEAVLDFGQVEIITSSTLSALLKLRKMLADCGRRLIFCNCSAAIRGVFKITGLDEVFEFVDDKFVALASLQCATKA